MTLTLISPCSLDGGGIGTNSPLTYSYPSISCAKNSSNVIVVGIAHISGGSDGDLGTNLPSMYSYPSTSCSRNSSNVILTLSGGRIPCSTSWISCCVMFSILRIECPQCAKVQARLNQKNKEPTIYFTRNLQPVPTQFPSSTCGKR